MSDPTADYSSWEVTLLRLAFPAYDPSTGGKAYVIGWTAGSCGCCHSCSAYLLVSVIGKATLHQRIGSVLRQQIMYHHS